MQARALSPKSGSVTDAEFETEREKAVGNANPANVFLLFTGVKTDVFLRPASPQRFAAAVSRPIAGIVDAHNWSEYWGPFAARAFLPVRRPDINCTSLSRLEGVVGIGPVGARAIVTEYYRGGPFRDYAHARARLDRKSVSDAALQALSFPRARSPQYM